MITPSGAPNSTSHTSILYLSISFFGMSSQLMHMDFDFISNSIFIMHGFHYFQ